MFDEEPDRDPHGECRAEIARLTAELCAEQDKRSDVIRERNEAIEEARNATAVNRILKAEVPRLEAEVARLTAELAAARGNDHGLRSARRLFVCEIAEAAGIPEPQIEHRIETSATPENCKAWDDAAWSVRCAVRKLRDELVGARTEVNCGQDGPCVKAPGCARHWQERNRELADELAAARAVPADVEAAIESLRQVAPRLIDREADAAQMFLGALDHLRDATAAKLDKVAADGIARGRSWEATEWEMNLGVKSRDEAIKALTAARGTVGGLLATAREGEIVEWQDGDGWQRVDKRIGPGTVDWWSPYDDRWVADDGYLWPSALNLPARLVPAAEADADPDTRGPLPKGG